jgi:hypothetical protein
MYNHNKEPTLSKICKLRQAQHQVQWCLRLAHFGKKTDFYTWTATSKTRLTTHKRFGLTCGRFTSKCNAPVTVYEYIHLEMVY